MSAQNELNETKIKPNPVTLLMHKKPTPSLARLSLLLYVVATLGLTGFIAPTNYSHRNGAQSSVRESVYSPYLDVNLAVHSVSTASHVFFDGAGRALMGLPKTPLPIDLRALTLAFASGECGNEHWGGLAAQKMVDANLDALKRADIGYIISTGGADGVFSCGTESGMKRFISRYDTSHLLGFDFNIEANQPEPLLESLVEQIRTAMQRHPNLRFSFTLAAIGATQLGQASLNAHGHSVMQIIQRAGLTNYFVNLMVMNYGSAMPGNCVVNGGQCDMSASAIQAVRNFSKQYGVPLQRIEVTPMIGMNDVRANIFTLQDAQALASFVRSSNLGGLHFWSLNRDGPCDKQYQNAVSTCSSLEELRKLDFTNAFALDLR